MNNEFRVFFLVVEASHVTVRLKGKKQILKIGAGLPTYCRRGIAYVNFQVLYQFTTPGKHTLSEWMTCSLLPTKHMFLIYPISSSGSSSGWFRSRVSLYGDSTPTGCHKDSISRYLFVTFVSFCCVVTAVLIIKGSGWTEKIRTTTTYRRNRSIVSENSEERRCMAWPLSWSHAQHCRSNGKLEFVLLVVSKQYLWMEHLKWWTSNNCVCWKFL
jgi:hypothetical protein